VTCRGFSLLGGIIVSRREWISPSRLLCGLAALLGFGGGRAAFYPAQRSPEGVGHNLPRGPPGSPCWESRVHSIGRCCTPNGSSAFHAAEITHKPRTPLPA
jgi:hypothetical protein